ncbi:MAG: hypothetical protein AAGH89_18880 [Verrucomicrobiota bacterium]
MSLSSLPESRLRALLSDCTKCLLQQMYFWGRDVIYPEGNLLCEHGFERNPSEGLQGTSCYRMPREGGYIELHGSCAGWYADSDPTKEGFVFIRPLDRFYRYFGECAPIPGDWDHTHLRRGSPHRIYEAAEGFIRWWLLYEDWIEERTAPGYRKECHRIYRKLPGSPNWLSPHDSLEWLRLFLENPSSTPRAQTGAGQHQSRRTSSQSDADLPLRDHSSISVRNAGSV